MLLDVDSKINVILSKISSGDIKEKPRYAISQEQIKDFILFLLIKYSKNRMVREEELIWEILNIYQCNAKESAEILSYLKGLGIDCCKKYYANNQGYDLIEFAFMRRYILPSDPFVRKIQSLHILQLHSDSEKSLLKKRFKEKYGNKETWSDETFEEYEKEQIKNDENFAESFSSVIAEALESISDQKEIKKYLCCINTFF